MRAWVQSSHVTNRPTSSTQLNRGCFFAIVGRRLIPKRPRDSLHLVYRSRRALFSLSASQASTVICRRSHRIPNLWFPGTEHIWPRPTGQTSQRTSHQRRLLRVSQPPSQSTSSESLCSSAPQAYKPSSPAAAPVCQRQVA